MALLTSELTRLKYEMGWNTLAVGATYYIGVAAVFEQVIATYSTSGALTTSSTAVVITAGAAPTPRTLTLASATGFSQLDRIVVDVDGRQEIATIESVSGSTVTAVLSKPHSGTYPVTVEGGESIIRGLLGQLYDVEAGMKSALSSLGIKKVDEIEFFQSQTGAKGTMDELRDHRAYLRDELWIALFGQGRTATLEGSSSAGGNGGQVYEAY